MIEEYTVRFLNAIAPHIASVPPLYFLGGLVGIINGCLFFLGFGRGLKRFLPSIVIAAAGAVIGATVGSQLPDSGPMLGDANVLATSAGAWGILFIARSLRL